MTESAAIVTYLSDRYAQDSSALVPRETVPRAHCLEWCFFIISELDAASLYVVRRHRDLASIYGAAPDVCASAIEYFHAQMRTVERALADGRKYMMGDTFSAADILLSSCLTWAMRYGVPLGDTVKAYNERVIDRPAYRAALVRNAPPQKGA